MNLASVFSENLTSLLTLSGEIGTDLEDWVTPAIILGATIIAVRGVRLAIKMLGREKFGDLAPAFSRLIYIAGGVAFLHFAPLGSHVADAMNGAIYVIGIVLALNFVMKVALLTLEKRSQRASLLDNGFIPLFRNLLTLIIFLTGVIIVLRHFNYDVMSLLTALGVGSLAVGLAAQPTLSNMISGFTLIIDRNLRPGDRITLGAITGDVEQIGLRSTRMRTGEGNMLIVPNSEMVNSKIINLSYPDRAVAVSSQFRAPLDVPFERLRDASLKSLAGIENVLDRPPSVQLTSIAEGCQLVTVAFWVADSGVSAAVISNLNERLLTALRTNQISLSGSLPMQSIKV